MYVIKSEVEKMHPSAQKKNFLVKMKKSTFGQIMAASKHSLLYKKYILISLYCIATFLYKTCKYFSELTQPLAFFCYSFQRRRF